MLLSTAFIPQVLVCCIFLVFPTAELKPGIFYSNLEFFQKV